LQTADDLIPPMPPSATSQFISAHFAFQFSARP